MSTKLDGIIAVGRDRFGDAAEDLLLRAEARKTADRLNQMGRGEVTFDEDIFSAQVDRLVQLLAAIANEPGEKGAEN